MCRAVAGPRLFGQHGACDAAASDEDEAYDLRLVRRSFVDFVRDHDVRILGLYRHAGESRAEGVDDPSDAIVSRGEGIAE